MKIVNKKLISVSESDLKNGVFENKTVTEVADNCFNEMPSLKKVVLPKVKTIGSYCFRYNQALTEISLPALTTAGSDCFRYNQALTEISLPALTTAGSDCFRYNQALTEIKIKGTHLSVKDIDGYCFVIQGRKTPKGISILSGYTITKIEESRIQKNEGYVASKNSLHAHGGTVKEAISDLQFKIVSEKLKNDPISPDTEITVQHYRAITGACNEGCRMWMESNGIGYTTTEKGVVEKSPIKAKDLVKLLEKTNAYGVEKFRSLITE